MAHLIGALIGWLYYLIPNKIKRIARMNLYLCFPQLDQASRAVLLKNNLIETGKTFAEMGPTWLWEKDRVLSLVHQVKGKEILDAAVAEGNGVILALPHIGNWELFNAYFASRGKMTALYQPPRKAYLQRTMEKVRSHFGNEFVPTSVKGITRLYRVLKEAGVVTILPDQVPASGIYVPFFGNAALTDKLLSRLVLKTHARVVAVSVIRLEDGRFEISFTAVDGGIYSTDMEVSVRAINITVENCVREIPAQYQWEYKRFRERPPGEGKIYRFNKPRAFH